LIPWQIGVLGDTTFQKYPYDLSSMPLLVERLAGLYPLQHEVFSPRSLYRARRGADGHSHTGRDARPRPRHARIHFIYSAVSSCYRGSAPLLAHEDGLQRAMTGDGSRDRIADRRRIS